MPSKTEAGKKSSREIWYFSFESLEDRGTGLATYCREVVNAAIKTNMPIRLFEINRGSSDLKTITNGVVTRILVPDVTQKKHAALGYWMNLSYAFAEAALQQISIHGAPQAIEIPDGFAIGYFLLQHKLIGDQRLENVPIYLTAHTPLKLIDGWNEKNLYALPSWWTYRAEKWCFHAADGIIVLSDMLHKALSEEGYLAAGNPVFKATNPYAYESDTRKIACEKSRTIGMASRMTNWKGLREALTLIRHATKSNVDLRLELCGQKEKDYEAAKKEFGDVFDSNRVDYIGVLTADELIERRKSWLCQIHPSKQDNFPYAVIEALTQGTPCLISPNNGVAEVLSDELKNQLVVDFNSPEAVMSAIKEINIARKLLQDHSFDGLSAQHYFETRQSIIHALKQQSQRTTFPFIDLDQAKSNLKPMNPIAPTANGARITVVIPYYNMADYIDECVASVLASSVTTQIVLVNDGSTQPKSIAKLDEFRNHPQIRVLDLKNGGVARARNSGAAMVQTEFMALLDADDTVENTYYEKALAILDRYDNVGFVGSWCNDYQDETGETIRYWPTYNAEPMPNIVMNNTNCQSLVYRHDLYMEAGQHDPDLRMYLDDWDGMLGMLEGGYFGVMLPGAYFNYRQRKGSIFSTGKGLWAVNYSRIVKKRKALFEKNAAEALLFSDTNGPNNTFHLLGWPTPLHQSSLAPTGTTAHMRLPMPYRLARSLAKRLSRFAEKGYSKK